MGIIEFKDLASIREKHKNQKIVVCTGAFDIPHAGHALFFEDCKMLGDILVVGVGSDYTLRVYKKKGRPVMNQFVRIKMISSLKPVDYAFFELDAQNNDALYDLPQIFSGLKPDVYAVNEDAFDIPRRKEIIKEFPVNMVVLNRTCPPEFENISATKVIKKIKEEVEA